MKAQVRSAVCVVRSADLVQRITKDGPKNQLEVVTDEGKLQTWNAGLWSAVQPLIGCYAAVEYHDKPRPYPGEWLLDQVRPATDSEADAYIAGEAPRLPELTVEQAIAAPPPAGSDSTRLESAGTTTAPVRAQDVGWSAGGLESPAVPALAAAAAQGGISDAQIHAQSACTVAAQLVSESSVDALDALTYVKTVKALTKVFSEGASDERLADLAEVLGATVVCLVPARTDTRWWHQWAMRATEIRLLQGRLKFGDAKTAAPFPSAVVIFRAGHSGAPHFSAARVEKALRLIEASSSVRVASMQ